MNAIRDRSTLSSVRLTSYSVRLTLNLIEDEGGLIEYEREYR